MTPKPPPPDQDRQHPADEVPPGTPQTAEGLCPRCGGSGKAGDGPCPDCDGTGTVNVNVGDA